MSSKKSIQPVSRRLAFAALAAAVAIGLAGPAFAVGETTGGIVGSVHEGDHAIAGAQVSIRQLDTGLTRTVSTDAQGNFRMPLLPVGGYEVTVNSAGSNASRKERTLEHPQKALRFKNNTLAEAQIILETTLRKTAAKNIEQRGR